MHDLSSLITHRTFHLGDDLQIHAVEAGEGPLIILLHGFPEFWYTWKHQIPALVEQGYRVLAPDMRGYNLSSKPSDVSDYSMELLTADVDALIHACGEERATVIGHDWGGIVAWWFAMLYPHRVERVATLNAPHPAHARAMSSDRRQIRKSWYMLFFQIPALPEIMLQRNNFAGLRGLLRTTTMRRGAFSPEDIDRYAASFAQPGALRSALHYYRALLRSNPMRAPFVPITCPTCVIWGEQDEALSKRYAQPPSAWTSDVEMHWIPDASHWVQNDRPEKVNAKLVAWLAQTAL